MIVRTLTLVLATGDTEEVELLLRHPEDEVDAMWERHAAEQCGECGEYAQAPAVPHPAGKCCALCAARWFAEDAADAAPEPISWLRSPAAGAQGWTALVAGHRWTVRGPMFGRPMFWLYRDGNRVGLTGSYDDSASFATARAAKAFAATLSGKVVVS